jgi:hypothetical protein
MGSPFDKPEAHSPYMTMPGTFQTITPSISTELTIPSGAKMAEVGVEVAPIRWRDDDTDPSATVGHLVQPGTTLIIVGSYRMAAIEFIDVSAASTLSVSYYR